MRSPHNCLEMLFGMYMQCLRGRIVIHKGVSDVQGGRRRRTDHPQAWHGLQIYHIYMPRHPCSKAFRHSHNSSKLLKGRGFAGMRHCVCTSRCYAAKNQVSQSSIYHHKVLFRMTIRQTIRHNIPSYTVHLLYRPKQHKALIACPL